MARRKSVKSETTTPVAEESETALPGMEADGDAAAQEGGEEAVAAVDGVAEDAADAAALKASEGAPEAECDKADIVEETAEGKPDETAESETEETSEGEPEETSEGKPDETAEEAGPKVHLPNLVCVRYYGAETWTLREAVKMPYPELSPGDVVVTDRKTAKWLTRKGMPFKIVGCDETLCVSGGAPE